MNDIVKEHLADLGDLCRRHAVRRLALFGSATRPDFDAAHSDLDFLVDFQLLPPQAQGRNTHRR